MGLLKTLFFILIFFYGFKFLAKLFAPFLLKKAAETIKKKAEQQFSGQQKQQQEGSAVEWPSFGDSTSMWGSSQNA